MATKIYEGYKVEPKYDKNGKPAHKKLEKIGKSILTEDQAQVLNTQTPNTKVYYYEVGDLEKPKKDPEPNKE